MREKNSVILRRAKDIIKTDGWTRGLEGMLAEGPACLLGAVGRAAGIKPDSNRFFNKEAIPMEVVTVHPAAQALASCIKEATGGYPFKIEDTVWKWNDLRGTEQKALDILNDCANREEEAGR